MGKCHLCVAEFLGSSGLLGCRWRTIMAAPPLGDLPPRRIRRRPDGSRRRGPRSARWRRWSRSTPLSLLSPLSSLSSDCHLGSPGVAPLLLVSHRHLGSPGVAFGSSSTTHTCLQTPDGHLGLPGVASALGDRRQHLPSCSVHLPSCSVPDTLGVEESSSPRREVHF